MDQRSGHFYVTNLHQTDTYYIPPFNTPGTGNAKDLHPQNFRFFNQTRGLSTLSNVQEKKKPDIHTGTEEVYLLTSYKELGHLATRTRSFDKPAGQF